MFLGSMIVLCLTSSILAHPLHSLFKRSSSDNEIAVSKKSFPYSDYDRDLLYRSFADGIWNSPSVDNRDGLTADEITADCFNRLGRNRDLAAIIGADYIRWGDMNNDGVLNYHELLRAVHQYDPTTWV